VLNNFDRDSLSRDYINVIRQTRELALAARQPVFADEMEQATCV
jgi:hypothetical protein